MNQQSMPIPDGSVIITPMQQYEEQKKIGETLRDVSNKLDAVTVKLDHSQEDQAKRMDAIDGKDGAVAKLDGRLDKHDGRITSLERWRWVTTGAAVVLSSAATGVVEFLVTSHK